MASPAPTLSVLSDTRDILGAGARAFSGGIDDIVWLCRDTSRSPTDLTSDS
jgi:hypothetical protein